MALGITLIVLMALLAIAVVVVIIGYSAQVVQRYKMTKNQVKDQPGTKTGGNQIDESTPAPSPRDNLTK